MRHVYCTIKSAEWNDRSFWKSFRKKILSENWLNLHSYQTLSSWFDNSIEFFETRFFFLLMKLCQYMNDEWQQLYNSLHYSLKFDRSTVQKKWPISKFNINNYLLISYYYQGSELCFTYNGTERQTVKFKNYLM